MTRTALIVSFLLCVGTAFGAETVRTFSWSELKARGQLPNGQVLPAGEQGEADCLKVTGTEGRRRTLQVLSIAEPGVGPPAYGLTGEVRHENVEGRGYLEMWNHFSGGEAYFSRTLADSGPLRHLGGTSDWRPFTLPFRISPHDWRPERLVVNVVLPGGGTVYLRRLKLAQYREASPAGAVAGAWWGKRTARIISGIVGITLGLLGGLTGMLAGRGRARWFVMTSLAAESALGVPIFVAGLVALLLSQPYPVYSPLLLIGLILAVLPALGLRTVRQRYERQELRKMKARDAV